MAIKGIQRTGFSCVADAVWPLSECICESRFFEMVTVSQNSIGLHGYFFGNIQAVIHFTD